MVFKSKFFASRFNWSRFAHEICTRICLCYCAEAVRLVIRMGIIQSYILSHCMILLLGVADMLVSNRKLFQKAYFLNIPKNGENRMAKALCGAVLTLLLIIVITAPFYI